MAWSKLYLNMNYCGLPPDVLAPLVELDQKWAAEAADKVDSGTCKYGAGNFASAEQFKTLFGGFLSTCGLSTEGGSISLLRHADRCRLL